MPRLLIIIFLVAATVRVGAERVKPIRTLEEVCSEIRASGPEAIEGVWRLTAPDAEGALIAIERDGTTGEYVVTAVDAPDRTLIPGTLLGRASRGARRGVYEAWLYADAPLPGAKVKTRRNFTLTLSDDGNRLEFKLHRPPLAFNLHMSIPYLFLRPSIRNDRFVERTPQGAERIFPIPFPPLEPIYL